MEFRHVNEGKKVITSASNTVHGRDASELKPPPESRVLEYT